MNKPIPVVSASAFIDEKIKELKDWRGKTLATVREIIHEADPDILEEWKWVKPTTPGTPVFSHGGIVCTGETYKNVILTTFLYVSPVQTMPPWEKTGVPGVVGLTHFHSSRISGSASCMISRTVASVFPRQSLSSLIFSSMNAEADTTGMGLFMFSPNSRSNFACARRNLQPP